MLQDAGRREKSIGSAMSILESYLSAILCEEATESQGRDAPGGQGSCTERSCTGKGGKCGGHVCSSNCVTDKQGKELAEAVAGKSFPLWQTAGASGLFNIPSNSCYVIQIRHHPDPNPASTSSQGGFQRSVWCLFWPIPGSLSHL